MRSSSVYGGQCSRRCDPDSVANIYKNNLSFFAATLHPLDIQFNFEIIIVHDKYLA